MKAKTKLVTLFCCLFTFCSAGIYSYAGEVASVVLTVKQSFVDLDGVSYSSEDEVTYQLSAGTSNSPLPSGSEDGQYSFSIKGNTTGSTAPILFKHAGIFSYELRAVILDSFPYTWSPQVFYIQVYVSNDGSSLIVINNQDQTKVAEMSAVYISPTRRPGNDNNNGNGGGGGGGSKTPTIVTITPEDPPLAGEDPSVGEDLPWFQIVLAKTGDTSYTVLWTLLCIFSLIGMIILYRKRNSKK